MRTRDGKLEPTSRWSCSEKLGHGKCALMYTFASPQDVHTLRMAFHEGDKAKREIKVRVYVILCATALGSESFLLLLSYRHDSGDDTDAEASILRVWTAA